jgi:hemoglobin
MMSDIKDVESVRTLLDKFYARAGKDDLLKPIVASLRDSGFRSESLCKYWQDAILGDATPERTDPPKHFQLMSSPQYFTRWLTLFFQTIDSLFFGPNAEKAKVLVIRKAEQFQESLEISRF